MRLLWRACCVSTICPCYLEPSHLPVHRTTRYGGKPQLSACWLYLGTHTCGYNQLCNVYITFTVYCHHVWIGMFVYYVASSPFLPFTTPLLFFSLHLSLLSPSLPPSPPSPLSLSSSRHSLNNEVIHFVHTKGCVGFCIRNIQLSVDQPPLDLVEIFATIFCCLKDSSDISQVFATLQLDELLICIHVHGNTCV